MLDEDTLLEQVVTKFHQQLLCTEYQISEVNQRYAQVITLPCISSLDVRLCRTQNNKDLGKIFIVPTKYKIFILNICLL